MNQTRALPFVLEILDDGLRLYRRHLASFILIATIMLVGVAVLAASFMALVRSELGSGWTVLGLLVVLIVSYPLLLYAISALSRATALALDSQPIVLRHAFRIQPLRDLAMIVYNVFFTLIAGIIINLLMFAISCPLSVLFGFGAILFVSSNPFGVPGQFSGIGLLASTYFGTMIQAGAWFASLVYAVQAFAQEQRPISQTVNRSLDMLSARFGRSLLMFFGAGAIFATLALAYGGTLTVIVGLITSRVALFDAPLFNDILFIVIAVASLAVLLPPLVIWMALFYRRLRLERDGDAIAERVAAWHRQAINAGR